MDIVLIPGLWLDGGTAWTEVAAAIDARGHRGVPVTLPGQGDGSTIVDVGECEFGLFLPHLRLLGYQSGLLLAIACFLRILPLHVQLVAARFRRSPKTG